MSQYIKKEKKKKKINRKHNQIAMQSIGQTVQMCSEQQEIQNTCLSVVN